MPTTTIGYESIHTGSQIDEAVRAVLGNGGDSSMDERIQTLQGEIGTIRDTDIPNAVEAEEQRASSAEALLRNVMQGKDVSGFNLKQDAYLLKSFGNPSTYMTEANAYLNSLTGDASENVRHGWVCLELYGRRVMAFSTPTNYTENNWSQFIIGAVKPSSNGMSIILCDESNIIFRNCKKGVWGQWKTNGGSVVVEGGGTEHPIRVKDTDADFAIEDEQGNIIFSIVNGYPKTKNFDGSNVSGSTEPSVNQDTKLPLLGKTPLPQIRFYSGFCNIFKSWGFIGDSLSSGVCVGYKTTEIPTESAINGTIQGNAIASVTDSKYITYNAPQWEDTEKIKLVFSANTSLSGKVLVAKKDGSTYTSVQVGSTEKEYIVNLDAGSEYVICFPSANVPTIMYQSRHFKHEYTLSWCRHLADICKANGGIYAYGGQTAKGWCEDEKRGTWETLQEDFTEGKKRDVYTIALGVNDISATYACVTGGTIDDSSVNADINLGDYNQNADTFVGWYAGIIQRIKSITPEAHIFCITSPKHEEYPEHKKYNDAIRLIVNKMRNAYGNNVWCVDIAQYNKWNDSQYALLDLNGHLSPIGYLYTAYEILTYIDWIIQKNVDDFKDTCFINTEYSMSNNFVIK